MPDIIELRHAAKEIFASALKQADARSAISSVVSFDSPVLKILDSQFDTTNQEIYVVAIGKAAHPMAQGLVEILGDRISQGLIVGPPKKGNHYRGSAWQVFAGGHPLPTEQSVAAARAAFEMMDRANERQAMVIFLISGGGSAMMEWPRNDNITIEDLRTANRVLVSSNATIREINVVRRGFSAIKGGGLALRAPLATQINLIVSDVNGGEEENVASGPSILATDDSLHPGEIIDLHELKHSLPQSVLQTIDEARLFRSAPPPFKQSTYVVMSNQTLLNAAAERARALGFDVSIDAQILEQPIELGCELLLSRLRQLQRESKKQVVCLLSGGEFRCPVRGKGQGGRNSETVLRCALLLDRNSNQGNSVVLSCGTDGVDGNSPAAGAIADQTTIKRGCVAGLDAVASLADSDSFAYFNSLGDAILTGPTGTNVRDLRILLANVQLPPVSQARNSFLTCPGAHAPGSMLSPAPQAKAENLPKTILLLRSDRSAKYDNIENVLMFPALACTGPGSFR